MEWYGVTIMCFIVASIGLLIGCMCRVAVRADERAGSKATVATGGIVKPGTWVYYPDCQAESKIKPVVASVKSEVVHYERARQVAKSAINLISMFYKAKRKKFRWKNYYKALKVRGRVANGCKRSEGSQYSKNN
ncbi:hypothetical protein SPSIL_008850 [Sporomusa silvacetica DSM 10669]|uniref:Uncharacterized protein n=1 Tax=Sporomusa silvacetica DSM 10669 TaxID=1123289 RepID=A0ABZ3IGH1_9FIRM|nr:hypothetical protein [Sporomusa silvacetica]OZC13155.1 hypothetical protein SPSIL_56110 [Sporomusa silvacetica DSM 10669]